MTDTTAKIRAKGCENTGLTEDTARKLWDAKAGKRLMAVVELEVFTPHGPDKEGKRGVDLVITQLEPAPDGMTEAHLRELTRSFHYERKLADGQLQIETGDDIEPKVADVLAAGKALEPHAFVPDSFDEGDCDVCGLKDDAGIHQVLTDDDPEDPEGDESDDDPETDEQQEPEELTIPTRIGSPFATQDA